MNNTNRHLYASAANRQSYRVILWIAGLLLTIGLAACDNLSKVGKQQQAQPEAVTSVLAQPYTAESNGDSTTTVRAGADVVLSGKNSRKSADDTGLPLINFAWEQDAADTTRVQLIRRTTNTSSFTAPEVSADTTLHFKLTVSNAKGVSATATAKVVVKAVRDFDHFLQYLRVDNSFPLVVTTQSAIAPNPAALPSDSLPVTVSITKLVTFTDRNGTLHTRVPVGSPTTTTASWSARAGTSTSCTANENPRLRIAIPRVNLDDLLKTSLSGFPEAVILNDVMENADVDGVTLEMQIDLSSTNGTVAAAGPNVCINGATTTSATGTILTAESLYATNVPRDSRDSALAYFAAIDPTNAKDTLDKWFTANGFDPAADGYNADAHAIYTNNFDLGFGRNMYLKFGACDSGFAQLPLQQRVGHCDVASVVINHVDLEAAAKKLNPVIAVAMEYSASPGTGARYTKFYAFVPDTRTGVFRRVLSVNLDRRGEQYMPQSCVVCHSGLPGTTANYATNPDVNATFIPWDLDSFLFADSDPGFGTKDANAALKAQYSRTAQAAELKKLNIGAYLTFSDPASNPGRYALARELVEGWYGGPGLPNDNYNDQVVPAGWSPSNNGNPSDSGTIYHEVFARHCRMCHVLQISANGDPRTAMITPQGVSTAIDSCSNDGRLANTSVGIASQVPMGCYWQFAHAPNLATRLGDGQMPFARRTTDRMWIASDSSQSPGQKLQAHLLATQGMNVPTPGTPIACIDNFGTPINGQSGVAVNRYNWVSLGSSCSRYLSGQRWQLSVPSGSNAVLIGTDTGSPQFYADKQGDYVVTLNDVSGVASATVTARVAIAAPSAGDGVRNVVLDTSGTATVDVDVMQLAGSQSLDALRSMSIVNASGVTATVVSTTATTATLHIDIDSLSGGTVTYSLTDIDGDQSNVGTITVNVSASIVANNGQIPNVATNGTSAPFNLSTLVSAASQPFTLTIQSQPVLNRGRGAGSVTNPDGNGFVTYTAPKGVASHIGAVQFNSSGIDSFTYQACFVDQPGVCATGTVSVPLHASTNFGAVLNGMGDNCSLCHATNPPTGAVAGDANPAYVISPSLTYNTSVLRKGFYCMLTTNSAANEGALASTAYVNRTNPASSLTLLKPTDSPLLSTPHGGGDRTVGGTDAAVVATLNSIFDWIDEGAYFTEGTSQTCP